MPNSELAIPSRSSWDMFWDATREYVSTRPDATAKSIYTTMNFSANMEWVDRTPAFNTAYFHLKGIRLIMSPGHLLNHASTLVGKVKQFNEDPSDHLSEVFFAANSCVHPTYDTTEFFTLLGYVPKGVLFNPIIEGVEGFNFAGINGTSLAIAKGKEGWDAYQNISVIDFSKAEGDDAEADKLSNKYTSGFLKMVKAAAYVVLGIIIVLSASFKFFISSMVFSMVSMATVVSSLASFYFDRLVLPPKKSTMGGH